MVSVCKPRGKVAGGALIMAATLADLAFALDVTFRRGIVEVLVKCRVRARRMLLNTFRMTIRQRVTRTRQPLAVPRGRIKSLEPPTQKAPPTSNVPWLQELTTNKRDWHIGVPLEKPFLRHMFQ
jgi:hypothetical protein